MKSSRVNSNENKLRSDNISRPDVSLEASKPIRLDSMHTDQRMPLPPRRISQHQELTASISHQFNKAYFDEIGCFKRSDRHLGEEAHSIKSAVDLSPKLFASTSCDNINWHLGPIDAAGRLFDLSDRNVLCSSLRNSEIVMGSADHSIYCLDIESMTVCRELHSSKNGHREWITCITHTSDDTIISGCAGGKICSWHPHLNITPQSIVDCEAVIAHPIGGISFLVADSSGHAVSCGYDGVIKIWDTSGRKNFALLCALQDKKLYAPILDCTWSNSIIVSGHRDGHLGIWNPDIGKLIALKKAHDGHTTVVSSIQPDAPDLARGSIDTLFASGGQDGYMRLWDYRCSTCVMSIPSHCGKEGVGAVGGICSLPCQNRIASYGADGNIAFVDIRKGLESRLNSHVGDFIYSMRVAGSILLTGSGKGLVLLHDLNTQKLMYGLHCNKGAVRCLESTGDTLATAGDDGNAVLYTFPNKNSQYSNSLKINKKQDTKPGKKSRPDWRV